MNDDLFYHDETNVRMCPEINEAKAKIYMTLIMIKFEP